MLTIRRILQLKSSGFSSRNIARSCKLSRTPVDAYLSRIAACYKSIPELLALDDPLLATRLHPITLEQSSDPCYEEFMALVPQMLKELDHPKVTRMVLWEEYIQDHPDGYKKSQFYEYLDRHLKVKNVTMHLEHVPGDAMYFDFAGDTLSFVDTQTGELIRCQVFVALFPYSSYTYVEACPCCKTGKMLRLLSFEANAPSPGPR